MAKIPERGCPTLAAIDRILEEENAAQPVRGYLGMSGIGDPCSRKLWYRLNGRREVFGASTLKIFNSGHRAEDVMAAYLRKVPEIELLTHDENNRQYKFTDGFMTGHCDGVIRGILQAPKAWHIWEHKEVNEKKFNELKKLKELDEKSALEKWDGTYYAQAVLYMHFAELDRHFLTVSTNGVREYMSVRTNGNNELALSLREKAKRIVTAKEPPERIGGKDYYLCKWCAFYRECHNETRGN